jgi:hypothetical protein
MPSRNRPDDAFVDHAKAVRLVFRGHEAGLRLGVAKRGRRERLTKIALPPFPCLSGEILINLSVATRDEVR